MWRTRFCLNLRSSLNTEFKQWKTLSINTLIEEFKIFELKQNVVQAISGMEYKSIFSLNILIYLPGIVAVYTLTLIFIPWVGLLLCATIHQVIITLHNFLTFVNLSKVCLFTILSFPVFLTAMSRWNTGLHTITEVKHRRAWLVRRRMTVWDYENL